MPFFSLRRSRSRRAMNTSTSSTSPLTIPPTSPSPPPRPRHHTRFLFAQSSFAVADRTALAIEAETQRLLDKHDVTTALIPKLYLAASDHMFPLSRNTGMLRLHNGGVSDRIPANWANQVLASPPPVACDLGTIVRSGDDSNSPTMRVFLEQLGRELEKPTEPQFAGVESVAQMRGELSRAWIMALDELHKANLSWERQVAFQLRERVKAIGYMEKAMVVYKRVNAELLELKEEVIESEEEELVEKEEDELVEPKEDELVETKDKELVDMKDKDLVETKDKEMVKTKDDSFKPKEDREGVPEEEPVLPDDDAEVFRAFANGSN